MRLRHLRTRIQPSLKAALAGWAAAMVVTLPMQFVKIVANSFGGPATLAAVPRRRRGGLGPVGVLQSPRECWLFGFLPIILLVPESWLLRHLRTSLILAAVFGWMVVLVEFKVWKLLVPISPFGRQNLHALLAVCSLFTRPRRPRSISIESRWRKGIHNRPAEFPVAARVLRNDELGPIAGHGVNLSE